MSKPEEKIINEENVELFNRERGAMPKIAPGDLLPKSDSFKFTYSFRNVFDLIKYGFKYRNDLFASMKREQQQEKHILAVAKYITEQNEISLRDRKRSLKEIDEGSNPYKFIGTMDRDIVQRYAGDALDLAEKKKGDRIKLGELRE